MAIVTNKQDEVLTTRRVLLVVILYRAFRRRKIRGQKLVAIVTATFWEFIVNFTYTGVCLIEPL